MKIGYLSAFISLTTCDRCAKRADRITRIACRPM